MRIAYLRKLAVGMLAIATCAFLILTGCGAMGNDDEAAGDTGSSGDADGDGDTDGDSDGDGDGDSSSCA